MKFRTSSFLRVFAFAACSLILFSCEEEENYDNFGPSTFQDNEPKMIDGTLVIFDSVGQRTVLDTMFKQQIDDIDTTILSIDTVLMDTIFNFDTTFIQVIDTVLSSSVDDIDSSNVRSLSYMNSQILYNVVPISQTQIIFGITGLGSNGEGIALTIPFPSVSGDVFTVSPTSPAQARYFTATRTYISNGFIKVDIVDTVNSRLKGSYSFKTNNSKLGVRDGSFDVKFDNSGLAR